MIILKLFKKESKNNIYIDFKEPYLKQEGEKTLSKEAKKETEKIVKKRITKTYIDIFGYRRFIDSKKLLSRWMVEKELGRKLEFQEVVHHIDGNKLNNNINNLKVFPNQKAHENHHKRNLIIHGSWYEIIPRKYTYSI